MFAKIHFSYAIGALVAASLLTQHASALSVTQSGTLAADNSVYTYDFTVSATQTYDIFTTSYGGGMNVNGTTTTGGGFVPVLTLFSSGTGNVVAADGADGTCSGAMQKSGATGMCDDAYIQSVLAPGSYVLDLTEFPNVAIGNLSAGFLFSSDPTATGDSCGVSGGMFLQADVAPCVQRTDALTVNIAATPEPATLWLVIPVLGLAYLRYKKVLSSSRS